MSEAQPAARGTPGGTLFLVPVALGEHTPWTQFLPAQVQAIAAGLRHFVVENARAARAHLKQLEYPHPLRETDNLRSLWHRSDPERRDRPDRSEFHAAVERS